MYNAGRKRRIALLLPLLATLLLGALLSGCSMETTGTSVVMMEMATPTPTPMLISMDSTVLMQERAPAALPQITLSGKATAGTLAEEQGAQIAPTPTSVPNPAPVATPTQQPTPAPATPTAKATNTPKPTDSPSPKPTATPKPTSAPTAKPTATPKPTEPPTPAPTDTPKPVDPPTQTQPLPAVSSGSYSAEDVMLAARIAYFEAGRTEEGYRAVLCVVVNRVESSRWPDTVSEVAFQKNQFTVVDKSDFLTKTIPDEVLAYADDVLNRGNRLLPGAVMSFRSERDDKAWGDRTYYGTYGGNDFYTS